MQQVALDVGSSALATLHCTKEIIPLNIPVCRGMRAKCLLPSVTGCGSCRDCMLVGERRWRCSVVGIGASARRSSRCGAIGVLLRIESLLRSVTVSVAVLKYLGW
jgi:hypothetical protein